MRLSISEYDMVVGRRKLVRSTNTTHCHQSTIIILLPLCFNGETHWQNWEDYHLEVNNIVYWANSSINSGYGSESHHQVEVKEPTRAEIETTWMVSVQRTEAPAYTRETLALL